METTVTSDPRCGTAVRFFARDTSPAFGAADQPLLESLIERFLIQVSQVFMLRVFDCRTMS